jgi:glucose dehydrogenase
MQGLTYDDLIDFTPELREKAIKAVSEFQIGPLFTPPLHRDNPLGKKGSLWCPGDVGGVNIDGPPAADPTTGILYVTSRKGCSSRVIAPGKERDAIEPEPTGKTVAEYAVLRPQGVRGPDDLPLFKPPYSRITAIDMNTGEHLWWVPVGETPNRIKNHPKLKGIDVGETGTGRVAPMTVTDTLLIYQGETSDGTPHLFALDKQTGKTLAKVKVDAVTRYGMMTYVHEGHQYIVLQAGPKLIAMALPSAVKSTRPSGGES